MKTGGICKDWAKILFSWRAITCLGLSVIGLLLYNVISWISIQILYAKFVEKLLLLHSDLNVFRDYNHVIVNGNRYVVADLCTYVICVMASIPFLWRRVGFVFNIFRIFRFVVVVFFINTLRIYFTIVFAAYGCKWFYCHTVLNYVLIGTILLFVFLTWYCYMCDELTKGSLD